MSRSIIIATAVIHQINIEDRWNEIDTSKVMETDLHYDENSFVVFLNTIRKVLSKGAPPYYLNYDLPFAKKALQLSVAELIGEIIGKVSTEKPAGWDA